MPYQTAVWMKVVADPVSSGGFTKPSFTIALTG